MQLVSTFYVAGSNCKDVLPLVYLLIWEGESIFWPAIGRIPKVGRLLRKMRGRQK